MQRYPGDAVQHHEAAYWTQKCTDTFERLYQEGADRAKIMAIAIHPYISGQPFRIKYLEACTTTWRSARASCIGTVKKSWIGI